MSKVLIVGGIFILLITSSCGLGGIRTTYEMKKVKQRVEAEKANDFGIKPDSIRHSYLWFNNEQEIVLNEKITYKGHEFNSGDRLFFSLSGDLIKRAPRNNSDKLHCYIVNNGNVVNRYLNGNNCYIPYLSNSGDPTYSYPTARLKKFKGIKSIILSLGAKYGCNGIIKGFALEDTVLENYKIKKGDYIYFKFDEIYSIKSNGTEKIVTTKKFPKCGLVRENLYVLKY